MKMNCNTYTVVMMSKTLDVSSSGYYKWLKIFPVKSRIKSELDEQIKGEFKKNYQRYGSPRIAECLHENNIKVSKTTVARRMKALNLRARPKRKYVNTTDSNHDLKIAENLLDRQFKVSKINTVWVSDITYVRVANSWMYLTIVMDLADRMIVGWSLSNNMTAKGTVINAFQKSLLNRGIMRKSNLMFHSDRGVQYACEEFRKLLSHYGCKQSMSRKGNCWDNAVAESFFKTIKIEALNRYIFKDQSTLYKTIFRYINGFYNTVRKHSGLDGMTPLMTNIKLSKFAAC